MFSKVVFLEIQKEHFFYWKIEIVHITVKNISGFIINYLFCNDIQAVEMQSIDSR